MGNWGVICYITVLPDEEKRGQNILSRDQAASRMSLPLSLFWSNLGFPWGYSLCLCLLQEEFKGSYKNTWLFKRMKWVMKSEYGETRQWWRVQLTKCTQKTLFTPWRGDAGWALSYLQTIQRGKHASDSHGGHMDKLKLAFWKTHWYSWKKSKEKCLLRICY